MVEKLWESDLAKKKKGKNLEKGEKSRPGVSQDQGMMGKSTVRMMSIEYQAHCFPSISTIPNQG